MTALDPASAASMALKCLMSILPGLMQHASASGAADLMQRSIEGSRSAIVQQRLSTANRSANGTIPAESLRPAAANAESSIGAVLYTSAMNGHSGQHNISRTTPDETELGRLHADDRTASHTRC